MNKSPVFQYFRIADHVVRIACRTPFDLYKCLPSFLPFRITDIGIMDVLMEVQLTTEELSEEGEELEKLNDVDYIMDERFILERGADSYLTSILPRETGKSWRMRSSIDFSRSTISLDHGELYTTSKLSWLIMIAFGQACVRSKTILVHASSVQIGKVAYAFLGKSGTGKSTHSELWIKYVSGCELLNDDNPAVRVFGDGHVYIYGTPWSGKKDCYRNQRATLGGITRLVQGPKNEFNLKKGTEALIALLPSGSGIRWDTTIYSKMVGILQEIVENVPIGELVNLPNKGAVELHIDKLRSIKDG